MSDQAGVLAINTDNEAAGPGPFPFNTGAMSFPADWHRRNM